MPIRIFYNPSNPVQKYQTALQIDPNIPAGYLDSQGSDGAIPADLKHFEAGVNSGGFPAYTGDQSMLNAQPKWPNGIFGTQHGNTVYET